MFPLFRLARTPGGVWSFVIVDKCGAKKGRVFLGKLHRVVKRNGAILTFFFFFLGRSHNRRGRFFLNDINDTNYLDLFHALCDV